MLASLICPRVPSRPCAMSSGALRPLKTEGEVDPGRDDGTRVTPVKRRRLLNLVDLRGPGGMTSSSVQLGAPSSCLPPLPHPGGVGLGPSSSLGHGRRSRTPLTDLDSKFVTKSGLCGALDTGDGGSLRGGSGVKITHLTGHTHPPGAAAPAGVRDDSTPRFPRLDQCAHFHYEYVELPPIQVSLVSEELKPLSQGGSSEDVENRSLLVQVTSLGRSWVVRRTYDNFRFLDKQLHRCCYDRKISQLKELPPEENLSGDEKETAIEETVRGYLRRLSEVAGSLITCGPVLGWLELDNRGHRLIVTDDSDINTPAVAAAYVVKRYTAQASDEISFEVGDMISVIDMPPPEESIWWRGKRGFQVGFFPCECVQVIGDKVPQAINPQSLTLPPPRSSSTPPTSGVSGPHPHHPLQPTSSLGSGGGAQEPMKPVLRKHGKLIAFFRSFILSRPSRRRLKQSGILRERVFGCDLGEHLLNSGHEIPMVLRCCAEFIESHGTVDGIYRLSGITSNIQKLRNAFDEERVPDLYGDESILQDIHCVSSVLKMYFRELPNPLLTYQLYDKFVTAVMQTESVRLFHVRDVVQQLPPPHYRTLEYLIQHLARIASHSGNTGMTPRNIAIVWAPNLLRSKDLEKGGVAALQDVGTQAVVTEYLVRFVDLIFNDKLPLFSPSTNGVEGTPKKLRPKSLAISTPTKLLSIDEARSRALAAIKSDQKYIEVGGGPRSLPKTYHTVIDLPSRKGGSLKQKKSPLGWKTLFSKNKHQRKASTPNDISLNVSDPVVTETDLVTHSARRLRPVKSVESLVSTPVSLQSNRNSQMIDSSPKEESSGQFTPRERRGSASSGGSSIPSPRTHNRSVSHDSYFNLLERSASANASPSSGAVKEERESDTEFSPESSKIFLDISELNLDFNTSEAEMKIFSEDETLKSTSIEDTLSRSTDDIGENISMGSDIVRSKENVSSRDKRSLKDKLKKRFTSPSTQRRDASNVSDSSEDSRSNSLKRASSVIKDKLVQALSPETLRKKGGGGGPHQQRSPGGSPKSKQKRSSDKSLIVNGAEEGVMTVTLSSTSEDHSEGRLSDDEKGRMSIESALIDPDLLDKITRMRVSPSVSASEASSVSLAEATVSDNESFNLGSSSNAGSNGAEALKDVVASDGGGGGGGGGGSTLPQSSLNTPCTPPVTIVADPHFQDEISKREQTPKLLQGIEVEEGTIKTTPKPVRDRPNSLLGIPSSDSCGLGSSLTSPETPQGDSTFLEIQYHPLSDTTEPSTPSESHFTGSCIDADVCSHVPSVSEPPRQPSPLSPDISSSSTDDPIENGPLYENVEVAPGLVPDTKLSSFDNLNVLYYDSSCKASPEVDTPTVEESSLEYENVQYNALEQSFYDDGDSKAFGSNSVTPCYENLHDVFPVDKNPTPSGAHKEEIPTMYENLNASKAHQEHPSEHLSEGEYEEYSFQEQPSYEAVQFGGNKDDGGKTKAEIEGEVVYQQVKYLRRSIQEVNEILNEVAENNESSNAAQQPLQSVNLTLCQPLVSQDDVRKEEREPDAIGDAHVSEGSECLDSPVTPSSSSLVTEVLVLPSFSSPTESTTEEATSPDASESQPSPKNSPRLQHHQGSPLSPTRESPSTDASSPNSLNSFIPTLSPPSPEVTAVVPLHVNSTSTKVLSATLTPSPWPRSGPKPPQVWPPVPKPRNLPALNVGSPLMSPTTPPYSPTPDSPYGVPELVTDPIPSVVAPKSLEPCPSQPPRNIVHIVKVPRSDESDVGENATSGLKSVINKFEEKVDESVFGFVEAPEAKSPNSAPDQGLSQFDGGCPPPPQGEEDEAHKRERIEKYKQERRSYLREKYKSESFKGEKDDMLLRLKQKATSPSRQEEPEENMCIDSSTAEKDKGSFGCPRASSEGDQNHKSNDVKPSSTSATNSRFQTSTSSTKPVFDSKVEKSLMGLRTRDEPLLHRSISEDSKVGTDGHAPCSAKESFLTTSSTTNANKSPSRTHSDSTFHGKSKPDEDVNVRERVAIWSRQEGASPVSSQKRDGAIATLSSKVTPPKLRRIQTPTTVVADLSTSQSKPDRRVSLPAKSTAASTAPAPTGADKPTSPISRNGRNQLPPQNSPKGADFPPLSPPNKSCNKAPSSSKPSAGKPFPSSFPGSKKPPPPLLSQKSESDLREPVPLKTRSYSVGTGLGTSSSSLRCSSSSQQKRIKDMKALFEGDSSQQHHHPRPVMIRQTTREGIGD